VRPSVSGKFLSIRDEKFSIRGSTYGPFPPDSFGCHYPDQRVVELDFGQIAANGMNAVRVYERPPCWLLDIARENGLRVMVGLPWEQHITFLDDKKRVRDIRKRIRLAVRDCARHPAVLCYAIGNEIPASVVRWHGARRVERFLEELYGDAKAEDPEGLFSYVNYPTTEYLELPFLDVVCFNVFLESQSSLQAYLARLQNLAGNRPLMVTELGLDSRSHGEHAQARALDWQIRTAFAAGCAGAFVFAWTDEWHRGGHDIQDWDFGLTDRKRRPKPVLETVRKAFAEVPFQPRPTWPRISVVICTFNGGRTIRHCLEGIQKLRYANYEVIVIDDGSTDKTAEIAREYPVHVISSENRGLSAARNLGMEAATGEIVAYLDDDASPDPDWLSYLATTFLNTDCAGVGGPNIPVSGGRTVAECVANSPGWPTHVLLSDEEAEHIPGCNMAFRKSCLQAIGGFDPQFRVAGDDVDICWRARAQGGKLAFSPAAMVWHHCRGSVRAYWKQQSGYGRAEALLERKWPEKYNFVGHPTWAGRVYNNGFMYGLQWTRGRIYQGTWGSASYGRLDPLPPSTLQALPLLPEWHLVSLALGGLCAVGYFWSSLTFVVPLVVLAVVLPMIPVVINVTRTHFSAQQASRLAQLRLRVLVALLHMVYSLARLRGRISHGLTPWRREKGLGFAFPLPWDLRLWSESWQAPTTWLQSLESVLRTSGAVVRRGGDYQRWDLEVRGGMLGRARILMAAEEHGAGRQLVRLRGWPVATLPGLVATGFLLALAATAAADGSWGATAIVAALAALFPLRFLRDSGAAMSVARRVLKDFGFGES
jgi:GT2 family glycosyltransferase